MIWTKNLNALHLELVETYSKQSDIIRLARQASIRTAFVTWQGQAMNDWFSILEEADKQGKLRPFLEFIKSEALISSLIDRVLEDLNADSSQSPVLREVEVELKPDFFISQIKNLLIADKLEDAIRLLRSLANSISNEAENTTINFSARLANLNKKQSEGTINDNSYMINRNQIRAAVLHFTDDLPNEIRLQKMLASNMPGSNNNIKSPIASRTFLTPPQGVEEKIIGTKNEMLPTPWLLKASVAAKSVCRVLVGGRADGTGFLLENGYVMTNSHVLPTRSSIEKATIEFNFEENQAGKSVVYKLDSRDVKRSPESLLDYCMVKVIDESSDSLKNWGFLELETKVEVRKGDAVNIIQHPWGNLKQIAFRDNKVISVWDDKIFYTTDSEHGSSGSPVFNDDWKVVALHSRGMNEDDGGMQINEKGDVMPANKGFSILAILADLSSNV